jgi:hypothetical protein
MSTADQIRNMHFRQFSKLSPEERLARALSTGHTLWQLMPEDSKRYVEGLRNGWKKYLIRSRDSAKN